MLFRSGFFFRARSLKKEKTPSYPLPSHTLSSHTRQATRVLWITIALTIHSSRPSFPIPRFSLFLHSPRFRLGLWHLVGLAALVSQTQRERLTERRIEGRRRRRRGRRRGAGGWRSLVTANRASKQAALSRQPPSPPFPPPEPTSQALGISKGGRTVSGGQFGSCFFRQLVRVVAKNE